MDQENIIACATGRMIKLEANKKAHYLPVSIIENPNFPLKPGQTNVIELYKGYIIIRPQEDKKHDN